jgi:hypothetical protein
VIEGRTDLYGAATDFGMTFMSPKSGSGMIWGVAALLDFGEMNDLPGFLVDGVAALPIQDYYLSLSNKDFKSLGLSPYMPSFLVDRRGIIVPGFSICGYIPRTNILLQGFAAILKPTSFGTGISSLMAYDTLFVRLEYDDGVFTTFALMDGLSLNLSRDLKFTEVWMLVSVGRTGVGFGIAFDGELQTRSNGLVAGMSASFSITSTGNVEMELLATAPRPWVNPFDLSSKFKLLFPLNLALGITLGVATPVPYKFVLQGGMEFDRQAAQIALSIEAPNISEKGAAMCFKLENFNFGRLVRRMKMGGIVSALVPVLNRMSTKLIVVKFSTGAVTTDFPGRDDECAFVSPGFQAIVEDLKFLGFTMPYGCVTMGPGGFSAFATSSPFSWGPLSVTRSSKTCAVDRGSFPVPDTFLKPPSCLPPPGKSIAFGPQLYIVSAFGYQTISVSARLQMLGLMIDTCITASSTGFSFDIDLKLAAWMFKTKVSGAWTLPGGSGSFAPTVKYIKMAMVTKNLSLPDSIIKPITEPIRYFFEYGIVPVMDAARFVVDLALDAIDVVKKAAKIALTPLDAALEAANTVLDGVQVIYDNCPKELCTCIPFVGCAPCIPNPVCPPLGWAIDDSRYLLKKAQKAVDALKRALQIAIDFFQDIIDLAEEGLVALEKTVAQALAFVKDFDKVFKINEMSIAADYSPGNLSGEIYVNGVFLGYTFDGTLTASLSNPLPAMLSVVKDLVFKKITSIFPDMDGVFDMFEEIEDTVKKTFSFRRRRRLLMVSSDVREPISPARLGALLGGAYLETSNSTLDGYQEYAPADGRTIEIVVDPNATLFPVLFLPRALTVQQKLQLCATMPAIGVPGVHLLRLNDLEIDGDTIDCIWAKARQGIVETCANATSSVTTLTVTLKAASNEIVADSLPDLPAPEATAACSVRVTVDLSDNQYGGSLPSSFASLSLRKLDVDKNSLTGDPFALQQASNIVSFDLSDNRLTDHATKCTHELTDSLRNLESYSLANNRFNTSRACNTRAETPLDKAYIQVALLVQRPIDAYCGRCGAEQATNCALFPCRNDTIINEFKRFIIDELVIRALSPSAADVSTAVIAWSQALDEAMFSVLRIEDRNLVTSAAGASTLLTFRLPVWSATDASVAAAAADIAQRLSMLTPLPVDILNVDARATCPAGLLGETCRYTCQKSYRIVSSTLSPFEDADANDNAPLPEWPSLADRDDDLFPRCVTAFADACLVDTSMCRDSVIAAEEVCTSALRVTARLADTCACSAALRNATGECSTPTLRTQCYDPTLRGFELLLVEETLNRTLDRLYAEVQHRWKTTQYGMAELDESRVLCDASPVLAAIIDGHDMAIQERADELLTASASTSQSSSASSSPSSSASMSPSASLSTSSSASASVSNFYPIIESIVVTDDYRKLTITLDVATNTASMEIGAEVPCSSILTPAHEKQVGAAARCLWTSNRVLELRLAPGALIMTSDRYTFPPRSLAALSPYPPYEPMYAPDAHISGVVTRVTSPPAPQVSLEGARQLGACSNLTLLAHVLGGDARRTPLFRWHVEPGTSVGMTQAQVVALDAQLASTMLSDRIDVPGMFLPAGASATIRVNVTNWVRGRTVRSIVVAKSAKAVPRVAIVGGDAVRALRRADKLHVDVRSRIFTCAGETATLSHVWSQVLTLADTALASTGSVTGTDAVRIAFPTAPQLTVRSHKLSAGRLYAFQVAVTATVTAADGNVETRQSVAVVAVRVVFAGVAVRIEPATKLTVSNAASAPPLQLDASLSLDLDTSATDSLSFAWTCSRTSLAASCFASPVATASMQSALLTVPAAALVNDDLTFAVSISSSSGSSAVATGFVIVTVVSPPVLRIGINVPATPKHNVNEPFSISAYIAAASSDVAGTDVMWAWTATDVDGTVVDLTDKSIVAATSSVTAQTLTLHPGVLKSSLQFTFSVVATVKEGTQSVTILPGRAETTVAVNTAPHTGSCYQTQGFNGTALEATFAFQCGQWLDGAGVAGTGDLPLSYRFRVSPNANANESASDLSEFHPVADYVGSMPAPTQPDGFVTLFVDVRDRLGATTTVSLGVQVISPTTAPETQTKALSRDLATATQTLDMTRTRRIIALTLGELKRDALLPNTTREVNVTQGITGAAWKATSREQLLNATAVLSQLSGDSAGLALKSLLTIVSITDEPVELSSVSRGIAVTLVLIELRRVRDASAASLDGASKATSAGAVRAALQSLDQLTTATSGTSAAQAAASVDIRAALLLIGQTGSASSAAGTPATSLASKTFVVLSQKQVYVPNQQYSIHASANTTVANDGASIVGAAVDAAGESCAADASGFSLPASVVALAAKVAASSQQQKTWSYTMFVSLVNFHDGEAAAQPATASSIVSLTLYDASFKEVAVNATTAPSLDAGFAPLRIRLPGAIVDASPQPVCRFWDDNAAEWSTDGCVADLSCNAGGGFYCNCTHLTDFQVATWNSNNDDDMPSWAIALIVVFVVMAVALVAFFIVCRRRLLNAQKVDHKDRSFDADDEKDVVDAAIPSPRKAPVVMLPELQPSAVFPATPSSLPLHVQDHKSDAVWQSRVEVMLPRFINADFWDEEVLSKAAPSLSASLAIDEFTLSPAPVVGLRLLPSLLSHSNLPRLPRLVSTPAAPQDSSKDASDV